MFTGLRLIRHQMEGLWQVYLDQALPGDGDAVADGVFDLVHLKIRGAEDALDGVSILRKDGKSEAALNLDLQSIFFQKLSLSETVAEGDAELPRFLPIGIRHQDDELIATVAEAQVFRPGILEDGAEEIGDGPEYLAADQMAMDVVDSLEVVEINE